MPTALAPVGLAFALLFELLEWLLISALLFVWAATLGWLLLHIADNLHFRVHIPGIWSHNFDLGGPFRTAEKGIREWMLAEKTGLDIEIGWTWNQLRAIWHSTAVSLEWLARETDASFDWLSHVKLPKWAKWAALAALPPALLAKIAQMVIARIRPELHKAGHVIARDVPTQIVKYIPYVPAVALPSPWAFPRFRHWTHDLARWQHLTGLRLKRLEALLTAAGLALAVAKLWGVRSACVRRNGNIGRAMRGLCGAPTWLLDAFLLTAFDAFAVLDLCQFVAAEVKLAEWLQPLMMDFVDVDEWLIANCNYTKPAPLTLPALSLPGGSYGVALNGPRDLALGLAV